jgi:probable addiction module antidote protein
MALETKPFDVADYLDSDEMIAAYLSEALKDSDAPHIAGALEDVARARGGISQLAHQTSLPEAELMRAADTTSGDLEHAMQVACSLIACFSRSRAA